MSTYIFNGRVLPERCDLSLSPSLTVLLRADEAEISVDMTVSVNASQVSVTAKTAQPYPDQATLRNYVEYVVRYVVDALGYVSGRGYDIEITSVVSLDPEQPFLVFGVDVQGVRQGEAPLSFDATLFLAHRSPEVRRALADLREAIRSPWDTAFFCFRAVEDVRQAFREDTDGDDRSYGWQRLRDSLRVGRSYIETLQRFAVQERHGQTPYMSAEDRLMAMHHAWAIVDRLCIYLSEGLEPLAGDKFELLE